jgi:hypothetical protein
MVPALEQARHIVGRNDGRARPSAEALPSNLGRPTPNRFPFADSAFDAVVSTFGVISTPNQDQVAAERLGLRCCVYPYVVVRFSCRDCPQIGRYRLAVPAEWLGAEALLVDVLEAISSTCRRKLRRNTRAVGVRYNQRVSPMPRERVPNCSRLPR